MSFIVSVDYAASRKITGRDLYRYLNKRNSQLVAKELNSILKNFK